MVANTQMKFTNIAITSKRFVQNGPNFGRNHQLHTRDKHLSSEIRTLKSMMAAGRYLKKLVVVVYIVSVVRIPTTYNKTANINVKTKS